MQETLNSYFGHPVAATAHRAAADCHVLARMLPDIITQLGSLPTLDAMLEQAKAAGRPDKALGFLQPWTAVTGMNLPLAACIGSRHAW